MPVSPFILDLLYLCFYVFLPLFYLCYFTFVFTYILPLFLPLFYLCFTSVCIGLYELLYVYIHFMCIYMCFICIHIRIYADLYVCIRICALLRYSYAFRCVKMSDFNIMVAILYMAWYIDFSCFYILIKVLEAKWPCDHFMVFMKTWVWYVIYTSNICFVCNIWFPNCLHKWCISL